MIPELLPGDVILSRNDRWISRAIRWFGGLISKGARFSHAIIYEGGSNLIEALWFVERSPLSKYDGQQIIIYRAKGYSDVTRESVVDKARSVLGQPYPILKIPLFALDAIFRTYWFTRTFGITSFKVCSNLVAWCYEKVIGNTVFGAQGWRSTSPDNIDDWCWDHPEDWEVIYDKSGEDPQ